MDGVYLVFWLAMIVLLAVIVLFFVIIRSDSKNEPPLVYSPEIHLELTREFMGRHKMAEAKKHALSAFRSGNREVQLQAVKLLRALHELEEF